MPKYSPHIKAEAIEQMKGGKNNTEISKSMGISTDTLRSWRKEEGLSPSRGRQIYTIEQLNDVIDLIREGNTMAEISRQTSVNSVKIKQWREEEIRNGNLLPEFTPQKPHTLKFSDEEIIDLAFLNPGFGLRKFIDMLGVKQDYILELFLSLKEFSNGEEDLISILQDPGKIRMVTREEYYEATGRDRAPKGSGLSTARGSGSQKGTNAKDVPLPPQEFHWGPYSPRSRY